MTAPVPKVELGFGSTWKTADASIVWTDATSDVRLADGIRASRGRAAVLERFNATDGGLVFNNEGRKYDGNYSAGAYFGDLVPGVPIRVTTTPSGQASRKVARGSVTGFPQRYDRSNRYSYVPIQFYGISDKLARAKLPQSAIDVEVLADVPVWYPKLDDISEAEMLDSSGNDHHGTYDNPELGQDPLVADGGASVFFDHVGDHRGKASAALLTAFPFTLEAWVKFDRDLSAQHTFVAAANDTSLARQMYFCTPTSGISSDGVALLTLKSTATRQAYGTITVDDGAVHHCVIVVSTATSWALYVDGVADTLNVLTVGTPTAPSGMDQWSVGNLLNVKSGDFGTGGIVDNVAVFDTALSGARVLAHYMAGAAPWDGDTTDERLDRILDVVGIPADRRDLQACTTILGPTVLGQRRALDYMRLVEASEDGRLFETADGKIRFLDRYWGVTDTHGNTSQQTFSDASGVSYSTLDIDPIDSLLVNVATIQREDAAALTIRNQTSIDAYGEADTSIDVLLQTDAEVRSLGEHIVLVRGTLQDRVSKLRVPLHKYTGAQQAAILDLDIGYRITVVRTPQGIGSATSLALIIEGVSHEINTFEHWIEFNVSIADDTTVGVWGSSDWGEGLWGW